MGVASGAGAGAPPAALETAGVAAPPGAAAFGPAGIGLGVLETCAAAGTGDGAGAAVCAAGCVGVL
jgi:hypothetical protein